MITIERWMVEPLRDKMMMTRESLAHVLDGSLSTIRNYEKTYQGRKMKQSIRRSMDRLMQKNGITVDSLMDVLHDAALVELWSKS
jgi:DNA-binding transcriptional regulator YiaG